MDREHHSHLVDGRRHHFWTDRLWALTLEFPVREVPIDDIAEFDQDCWFRGRAPTCRQVADHARRIQAADLRFPVILATDGSLMDGGHRISKAWLAGQLTVRAVKFVVDPPPDWVTDDQCESLMRLGTVHTRMPVVEHGVRDSVCQSKRCPKRIPIWGSASAPSR